ncbi:hypothetical protein [Clostridium botulinum]|uniref:hypothetical protein n=1 Tax=Clostridium botulinum TaxID=1491 RepID=UPI000773EB20|nr:hypothetical protein [Clostridium botulinum]APH20802.1 hypothetical protein NPD1_4317 [Clostridium botulinum]APQ71179.1 hypothetical protein RSJ8_4274 [Clostridium botulinum]MBN3379138.1 hypothetical protein [Clostridium botulinum]
MNIDKFYFSIEDLKKFNKIPKDSLLKNIKINEDDTIEILVYTNEKASIDSIDMKKIDFDKEDFNKRPINITINIDGKKDSNEFAKTVLKSLNTSFTLEGFDSLNDKVENLLKQLK